MEMNIDDVLNDSKEYGQVDDNMNDALKAILAGQKAIMDKVTELERKQMLLESNIVSDSRHIGVLDNESQNPNVLDGHSKVTIELPDSSANISTREKSGHSSEVVDNDDDNLGNDDNLDDEYTFLHTDNSDKTRKSFRRASVDAINKSLETLNINDFNVSTTMSFSEHQFKRSDKEIHMISNPKCLDFKLKAITVSAVFTLINSIETFVSNVPEAALCTGSLFSDSVKRQIEAYSCLHKPEVKGKSWSVMTLDEAILRCRLIAAPLNKGAIIMELQSFRPAFGNNFSMSPDKLVNVWSQLMSWLKDYEKYYYLCTFYDYSKNVYGLDVSQQPPNTGNFGLIAVMYHHFPTSLSTYIRRNFFDVDRSHGDTRYKLFASPHIQKEKFSFMYKFTEWVQSEYITALQAHNRLKETMEDKSFVSKSGNVIPGVNSLRSMFDHPSTVSLDATNSKLDSNYDGELVHISHDVLNFLAAEEDNKVINSTLTSDATESNDYVYDGECLNTYNSSIQRPPQVSTGGVVKHAAKLPTEVEVCFRMMRPPHVCTDPTCKRSHDKQKIYEVINANLKSLLTSKLSFVEDSTENQDNSP